MTDSETVSGESSRSRVPHDAGNSYVSRVVQPKTIAVEVLTEMVASNPTLLIIGQQKSVIDPIEAIANANLAGMQVKETSKQVTGCFVSIHQKNEVIEESKKCFLAYC